MYYLNASFNIVVIYLHIKNRMHAENDFFRKNGKYNNREKLTLARQPVKIVAERE